MVNERGKRERLNVSRTKGIGMSAHKIVPFETCSWEHIGLTVTLIEFKIYCRCRVNVTRYITCK